MKKIIAVIPARMASTRFPGKPLARICGKTMIEHVWQRTKRNTRISEAYIAACDPEVKETAEGFGAKVIMTSPTHKNCIDRVAEACDKIQGHDIDVVITVQGDEPLLNPGSLDLLIDPFLENQDIFCVNLIEKMEAGKEMASHNTVKTVFDEKGFVLYFSRLPIPYKQAGKTGLLTNCYKQLGLIGMTRETILRYPSLSQTPLELAESVDMLRLIEHRIPIKVALSPFKTIGVDTPADHENVCALMENDEMFLKYKESSWQ